eukprot:310788-Chlamydomonas_euryale.AAC.1
MQSSDRGGSDACSGDSRTPLRPSSGDQRPFSDRIAASAPTPHTTHTTPDIGSNATARSAASERCFFKTQRYPIACLHADAHPRYQACTPAAAPAARGCS